MLVKEWLVYKRGLSCCSTASVGREKVETLRKGNETTEGGRRASTRGKSVAGETTKRMMVVGKKEQEQHRSHIFAASGGARFGRGLTSCRPRPRNAGRFRGLWQLASSASKSSSVRKGYILTIYLQMYAEDIKDPISALWGSRERTFSCSRAPHRWRQSAGGRRLTGAHLKLS